MEDLEHPEEDAEFNEEERLSIAEVSINSTEQNQTGLRNRVIQFLKRCNCRCLCIRVLFYKWLHYTPEEELMKRHDYNRKIKIANLFEKTSMVTPLFALVFVGVIGYTHQKKYQVLLKIAYVVEALLIFFEVFQLVYISIAKSLPNPSGRIRYEVGVNGVRPPVKYAPLTPKENRISNFNVAGENHNSSSKENAKSSEKFSNVSEEHELFQRPSTFLKQGSDTEPSTSGLQPSKLKKNDFSAFYEKADSDDEDYDTPKLDHRNLFSSPSKKSSVVCVKIKPKPTIKPQSSAVNDETEVMIEETVL